MIITSTKPYTTDEIKQLAEEFEIFIKTVIDVEKRVCSAGANRHFENETILLEMGSKQENLWGGGINIQTKQITYDSLINIRPGDNNRSNEILDPGVRNKFTELTEYFFEVVITE